MTKFQNDLAGSYNNIGLLQSETGHREQALESYAKALAIRERLRARTPASPSCSATWPKAATTSASSSATTGHPDHALESYGKALAIQERLAREHPESPDDASSLGGTLNNMATIDVGAKRFEQARDKLQQAISWQKKALAANPRHPTYRQFLRKHLTNLIKAAKGLGNDDEARAAQRELDELAASDPTIAALDRRLAAVIRGEAPKDNRERLQLADRAYEKTLNAVSTQLYAEAIEADPKLADDRHAQHRYNAACAAALAAAAVTTPTPPSPVTEATSKNIRRPSWETIRAEVRKSHSPTPIAPSSATWPAAGSKPSLRLGQNCSNHPTPDNGQAITRIPQTLAARHRPGRSAGRRRAGEIACGRARSVEIALGSSRRAPGQATQAVRSQSAATQGSPPVSGTRSTDRRESSRGRLP